MDDVSAVNDIFLFLSEQSVILFFDPLSLFSAAFDFGALSFSELRSYPFLI